MDFKSVAKKVADSNSPILENREKMSVDEGMKRTKDAGLTVIGADLLNGEHGEYAAFIAKEVEGFYFNGGKAMTEVVKEWVRNFDGDCEAMSAELAESGGVLMKFEKTKTRGGNNFTKITIE